MLTREPISVNLIHLFRKYILPWKQYIVTIVVLLVSAYLAYFGSNNLFLVIIGLFAAAIGTIYLYQNMQHGLILLVLASFFVSFTIGGNTGINATMLLIIALAGLWLIDMVFIKQTLSLAKTPTILPLLLMIVVSVLAFINGQLPWFNTISGASLTAQLGGLMLFILSVIAFLLAVQLINDVVWLKRLVWLFLIVGAIFILTRFAPSLVRFGNRTFAYGSAASAGIFWLWLITLSASQGLFNRSLSKYVRIGLIGLLLATLYFSTVVAYDWKSGWLPGLVSLLVMFWFGFPKLRPLVFPAATAVLLLNFIDLPGLITGNEDYSVLTRVEAWRILLEIIKVNPFLGLGPSNYYWYTPLFPILGYSVSFNSHNNYIDIVAQIGVFGLIFFLWFFWELAKTAFQTLRIAPQGFERAYVIGALGGIAGTLAAGMLGDWIIPFVYNVGLVGFRSSSLGWIFLGGLVALSLILSSQTQDQRKSNL